MAIVYGHDELDRFVQEAFDAAPQGAILIDRFLEDAVEVDVDALADGQDCMIAGIMQHIEQAGVHSGDSCCVLPSGDRIAGHVDEIRETTRTDTVCG